MSLKQLIQETLGKLLCHYLVITTTTVSNQIPTSSVLQVTEIQNSLAHLLRLQFNTKSKSAEFSAITDRTRYQKEKVCL